MRQKETPCIGSTRRQVLDPRTGNKAMSNISCSSYLLYNSEQIHAMKMAMPDLLRSLGIGNIRQAFRCLKPEHEDVHPSMHYDPKTNRVKCFSCGASGDAIDVAGWVNGETAFPDKVKALEKLVHIDFGEPTNSKAAEYHMQNMPAKSVCKTQGSVELNNLIDSVFRANQALFEAQSNKGINYLRYRGFNEEEIVRYKFGWVQHPSEIMRGYERAPHDSSGYLCIPFPADDQWSAVYYCVFRPLFETNAKELKPKGFLSPIYKEYLLQEPEELLVAEGVFDAVSLEILNPGVHACALCGANIKRMVDVLRDVAPRSRPHLVLVMDNDKPGKEMAKTLSNELEAIEISCTIAPPTAQNCKDSNDLLIKIRRRDNARA